MCSLSLHLLAYPSSPTINMTPALTMPIVITGAGPAGLCLANILQIHSIPCVVYEAESGPNARNQGGTLDLHAETGLRALEAAGLLSKVMEKARTGNAEAMKVMKGDGTVIYDENRPDGEEQESSGRPEIDRCVPVIASPLVPYTIRHDLVSRAAGD